MLIILGTLLNDEVSKYSLSNKSKHMEERVYRENLISELAKPLIFFDVYRRKDNSRQVHCLLSDSSVIVFNKSSGLVITILILERRKLDKYIKSIDDELNVNSIESLIACSIINKKNNKDIYKNNKDYLEAKFNILTS